MLPVITTRRPKQNTIHSNSSTCALNTTPQTRPSRSKLRGTFQQTRAEQIYRSGLHEKNTKNLIQKGQTILRPPGKKMMVINLLRRGVRRHTCTASMVLLKAHVSAPDTVGMPFPSLRTTANDSFFAATRGSRRSRLCPVENTDK